MTLSTFKYRNVVPPGGKYFFIVPETDKYFESFDMYALERTVRDHLIANKLTIPPNLQAVIEHYMCEQLPTDFCNRPAGNPEGKTWLSSSRIRDFSKVFFNRMFSHSLVSEEQADARARVCMSCPMNLKNVCSTCNGLGGLVKRLLRVPRETSFDPALGACQLCGCLLRVKVHVPIEDLNVSDINAYPEDCWLKTEAAPEPAEAVVTTPNEGSS
jgi:hypothetical protein